MNICHAHYPQAPRTYTKTSRYHHTPPIFYRLKPVSPQLAATFRCFEGGSSLLSTCPSRKLRSAGKNKSVWEGTGLTVFCCRWPGRFQCRHRPRPIRHSLQFFGTFLQPPTNTPMSRRAERVGQASPRLTGPRRRCAWASSFAAGSARPCRCAGAPCHRRLQSAAARGAALPKPPRDEHGENAGSLAERFLQPRTNIRPVPN